MEEKTARDSEGLRGTRSLSELSRVPPSPHDFPCVPKARKQLTPRELLSVHSVLPHGQLHLDNTIGRLQWKNQTV